MLQYIVALLLVTGCQKRDPDHILSMLVSALMGLERMQAVYAHAIANDYRFHSYGDASLLLP